MAMVSSRIVNLIEPLAFCTYVALFIWKLQEVYLYSWIVFPIWLVASFLLHRDTPKTLGWRADNLWQASKLTAIMVFPLMGGLVILGALFGAFKRPVGHLFDIRHVYGYMAFCLLQQVALNSYVTNRLVSAVQSNWKASVATGAIFAALHWPNPVLVPLTAIAGAITAALFVHERNILPLAAGQGVLGTMVWWAFPIAWHHAMRVGPGFYRFHLR